MAILVNDCPRCGAKKITFDVRAENWLGPAMAFGGFKQERSEIFCVCRACGVATIFILRQTSGDSTLLRNHKASSLNGCLNELGEVDGFISTKDLASAPPPDHLPEDVKRAFVEGAQCLAIGCNNAAGTMFRLCVDLATRAKLPSDEAVPPNAKTRRDLGLRLPWLFDNGLLPEALRELSQCIREDGNDGAHQGTLGKAEAEDMQDFTSMLLQSIFTDPERVRMAAARRHQRRAPPAQQSQP